MTRGIEEIPPERVDLRFASLRLPSPAELSRLRASVEREGIRNPVMVSVGIEPGHLILIDGFKRVRVAKELGIATLSATAVTLDVAASKAAMLRCNAPHQGMSDVEEAWVVWSLCREHALTQDVVGQLLGRDQSWVSRRLALAEHLEPALVDDLRLGLLSSAAARELSRLPRGLQIATARAVREHGLASRQVAHLVVALKKTDDPKARREVLADPRRYLVLEHPDQMATSDPRLGTGGNDLRKCLLGWHGAAARLWRSLDRHAPSGLVGDEARVLGPMVGQTLRAGRRTLEKLEQLVLTSGIAPEDTAKSDHA